MNYRILARICVFFLIFSCLTIPDIAFADSGGFSLISSGQKVDVGSEVNISVQASQLQRVYGFELKLEYDEDKLQLLDEIQYGLDGIGFYKNDNKGTLTIVCSQLGNDKQEIDLNGTICTLTFRAVAKGNAEFILKSVITSDKNLNTTEFSPNARTSISIIGKSSNIPPVVIDMSPPSAPVVRGVENGKTYTENVSATWTEETGTTTTATLSRDGENPQEYKKGTPISLSGDYVLVVTAKKTSNGLTASTTIRFRIDIPQDKDDDSGDIDEGEDKDDTVKTFTDLDGYRWAENAIQFLASKGIVKGTSETTFSPGNNIIRADFIVLIVRAFGFTADVDDNFSDVDPSAYYYEAVGIAKKLGITSGVGNNKFNPKEKISRQDMMVLLYRALKIAGIDVYAGSGSELDRFSDKANIAPYAVEAIQALVANGIVRGDGTSINPLGNATRAEAAVLIYTTYIKYFDS